MKLSQIVKIAFKEAYKAFKKNEVPVGAVVFNDKNIISKAHNLVIKKKDPLAHAEILAIRKAVNKLNTVNLNRYKLYVTLEPCLFCSYAISKYYINSIYFGLYNNNNLGIKNAGKVLNVNLNGFKPNIYGGFGEEEISHLMKRFFNTIRKKN